MRYAGAFILLVCSVLAGACFSARTNEACDTSEEIYRIMKYIRERICVNRTPTKMIFPNVPTRLDITGAADSGLYEALSGQLACLYPEERQIFSSFCEVIGKGGAETQKAGFDSLIERYGAVLEERRKKSRDKSRVYAACSVFCGVCAVIIFL